MVNRQPELTIRLHLISMKRIRLWAWTSSPYYQIAVSLFLLIVPKAGGTTEGRVEVCEFQDVNLIFPNTPASSAGDIKAKTWNKENGIRLASWMASTNFVVSPSYGDRLTAIGENSIKIRNATRSDAGTYTLVLTSGSTRDIIEFLVHLEVLVSPSDQCTLSISREGDSLMAELPLEGCGSPRLSPRWINRTQKLIGNINVLKLDPGMGQEIYIVCAVGESRRCFQGDAKHLCANYTELGPKIESEPESVTAILMPVLIITSVSVIAVSVILAYYWRRKRKTGKRDSFSGCLPRKEAVPDNSYINLMLRELTTNNGHTVSSTGDHSTKDNPKDTSKKSGVSNQRSYCNVQ